MLDPSPFDILADELGAVAGRIERESALRIEAAISDIRRIDAERELRLSALERLVTDRLALVKDGRDGKDGVDGRDGRDAKDANPIEVANMLFDLMPVPKDGDPGPAGPRGDRGDDGKDSDPELIARLVAEAVANIPAPKDGERGEPGIPGERGDKGDQGERGADGASVAGPAGERGEPGEKGDRGEQGLAGIAGAPGKLPIIRAWSDEIHYQGDVVAHGGATYQASRDTGRSPPHEDWICLASAGRDGLDGRSFEILGTYKADGEYRALNVVALNGGAFVAKRDEPGPCPGDGWQLIASQGKQGKPGERGAIGPKGDRGMAGPAVSGLEIDGDGLFRLKNGDGTAVDVDLYPILSQLTR